MVSDLPHTLRKARSCYRTRYQIEISCSNTARDVHTSTVRRQVGIELAQGSAA